MNESVQKKVEHFCLSGWDFNRIDFMELLCCMDLGVLITDENGILIFYNDVQATIDNMDPSQVLGKPITDVYKYNNDSSTCMRVLHHGKPIINYSLAYRSDKANVGNTIHSVFPLFENGKIIGTICFVKDYNILERSIPAFLSPGNNNRFARGTKYTFASIIGSDPGFVNAIRTAKMAGNSPSPVLLYGETGTGKELFAQAIHNYYYRGKGDYVDVNCAAIPENLIEGLLFGTIKGAYTGAVDRAGLFEQANGGTIFLDEINSMPLVLQGKLLRVIQEQKVRRVGSLDSIDLNVKIISSMNQSPQKLVKAGTFRMDLFYRLGVIFIKIPPLRDRRVDIEELGRHFLQKYNIQLGRSLKNIAPEVIDFFWQYAWPGNVRELEHVIESAANFSDPDETSLMLKHCYFSNILDKEEPVSQATVCQDLPLLAGTVMGPVPILPDSHNLSRALADLEEKMICRALEQSMGNVAYASRILGISRQLLNHKIEKKGLRLMVDQYRDKKNTVPVKNILH